MKLSKTTWTAIKVIVTVLLFALVFSLIDFNELLELLKQVDSLTITLIFLILFAIIFIGAYNLYVLFLGLKVKIPFRTFMKHYTVTWGVANFLPGTTGDLSLLYFLKKEKVDYGKSFSVFMVDKILTLISLAVLTLWCALIFFGKQFFYLLLLLCVLGFIILVIAIYSEITRRLFKKYVLRKYASKFKGFYKNSITLLKNAPHYILLNLVLTFLKWFLTAYSIVVMLYAFGVTTDVFLVYLITSFITLIGMIPVSISGLGLREYFAILTYPVIGITNTQIVGAYIVLHARTYLYALIVLVYAMHMRKK